MNDNYIQRTGEPGQGSTVMVLDIPKLNKKPNEINIT